MPSHVQQASPARTSSPRPAATRSIPVAETTKSAHVSAAPGDASQSVLREREDPALPDALSVHFIRNLAVCAVEAVDGLRPIEQFANWITHEVATELAVRRQLRLERHTIYRDTRRRVPSPGAVTVSLLSRRTVEAAIVIRVEDRSFAVAMRLEWGRERWRATCLTVL